MPKWSPEINHLSYADDTILLYSRDKHFIIKMMNNLKCYEKVSGQMVNKLKSFFYLHEKTPLIYSIKLRRLTGIRQGNFPFVYLDCPIYYGRKRKYYFEDLIINVSRRMLSWQNKFLYFGVKMVLINHVLQSLPVYLLSAMNPPKDVLDIKCLLDFFGKIWWNKRQTLDKMGDLYFSTQEGGFGFRSMHDVNHALFTKL